MAGKFLRFGGEGEEDTLGDIVGKGGIAREASGDAVDPVEVARDEFAEGGFIARGGELGDELGIGGVGDRG